MNTIRGTALPDQRPSMHVLLLNQAFYPDVVATAQHGKDLADELVRRGHRVTAVASRSIYGKAGAVLPKREDVHVEGGTRPIRIERVGASIFGKAGYAARIADFALFYILAFSKVISTDRPDVVVSFTTPPFIGLVGIINRIVRGSKAVYWVMDLYPDLPVACGVMKPHGLATRFFEAVNRFILRHSDVDVVLGRCMQDLVLSKSTPAEKVRMISIWSDTDGMDPIEPAANPVRAAMGIPPTDTVVMYSGNFGIGHDAQTICRAMARLQGVPGLRFEFVGGGKRRGEVEKFIAAEKLTNVRWHDYAPREKLGPSLAAGDIHLISLKEGVEGIMVPSKLMGILAVGRPSIFVGNPTSEVARVLTETNSGVVVREDDDAALAEAIKMLAGDPERRRQMGENARRALHGTYDAHTACRHWVELLEEVTGEKPRASLAPEKSSHTTPGHASGHASSHG
ncbi:MAG TPA: glycosyltransferase family 4 protein [Phycisphaerales bacterium]|nr:glycosyltransferase family 4 protein [Phycisphaerales bacterium]